MATYSTRQQRAVLDCLAAYADRSVSAAELTDALHARGENIGAATVYRQLERLERSGLVHRAVTDGGAYYRYCAHGAHSGCFLLKCERCGRIVHADCEQLAPLYRHLEQTHHFSVNPRRTMFYGLCPSCREDV